jgi:hypothetical protein
MKNILLLLLTFTLITSCNQKGKTKEEKIRENIEAKLKPTFKDPASYEFVSMSIKKTFSVAERKQNVNEEQLENVRKLNEQLPSEDLLNQIETEFGFLKRQTDDNKDAVYYVDFVAKGTNSFGGIIQSNYSATVLNDENYTVVGLKSMD